MARSMNRYMVIGSGGGGGGGGSLCCWRACLRSMGGGQTAGMTTVSRAASTAPEANNHCSSLASQVPAPTRAFSGLPQTTQCLDF